MYRRHDDIKTIVAAACSNSGLRTKVKLSGAHTECQERPADVAILGWNHSDAWVDVAVVIQVVKHSSEHWLFFFI